MLTGGLLILVAALAWIFVIRQSALMQGMPVAGPTSRMSMVSEQQIPSLPEAAAFLLAWGVMMAAMMLPSATPMIALYGTARRDSLRTGEKGISTGLFALVYAVLWLAFGIPVLAASVAVAFEVRANPAIADLLPYSLAAVLLAAGAYQFSPWKHKCLRVCRSPFSFLLARWQSGYLGTFKIALDHAVYCIGCCWALMVILVAVGAMALPWVLLIAVIVFAEKLLPGAEWTTRLIGTMLVALGVLVAVQPGLAIALHVGAM